MPSIYTHNYFARDTYKKLENEKIRHIDNKIYYEIFAQSFDNLFFYDFFIPTCGKKYRKLGYYAQKHNVWLYFKNIIEYIKNNNLYTDENLGYLYGSLAHYAMDSSCHPYIHYISGKVNKKNLKETRKYIGNHAKNEIMIDAIYYYKEHNEKYYKYKLYKELIPKIKFPKNLIDNIDYVFKETFDKDNIGHVFNKSYIHMRYSYKYLMYDRTGVKTFLYKLVDTITPHKNFKANNYSNHISDVDISVMNEKRNTWIHPITGDKHNESFEDLYDIAQKNLISYIKICNKYFDNKCTLKEVEKVIGNTSYSSGLDASIKPKFKYFKD